MEEVMSFLETNYLWVIIIAIVLVVTIIGYFADKKGIGKIKNKKENKQIDIKKEVVKIPDVQETISNLEEDSKIIDENYIKEISNNETSSEVVEESSIFPNEIVEENNQPVATENFVYNDKPLEVENVDNNNDVYDEYDLDRISKKVEEDINERIENDVNNQLEEVVPESLEFSAEPDEYMDLFKDESAPEKIEVPDAEPTETLNIDNDFNKLLNDFDDQPETINYELPTIESIDSSDLTDDDDIWNF